jgi:putative ABC transport system substrate-binding protein
VFLDRQIGALMISLDTFYLGQMERFASLAVRHALPAIGPIREFARSGGLMSYGTSISETYRREAVLLFLGRHFANVRCTTSP